MTADVPVPVCSQLSQVSVPSFWYWISYPVTGDPPFSGSSQLSQVSAPGFRYWISYPVTGDPPFSGSSQLSQSSAPGFRYLISYPVMGCSSSLSGSFQAALTDVSDSGLTCGASGASGGPGRYIAPDTDSEMPSEFLSLMVTMYVVRGSPFRL